MKMKSLFSIRALSLVAVATVSMSLVTSKAVAGKQVLSDFPAPELGQVGAYSDLFGYCQNAMAILEQAQQEAQMYGNANLRAANLAMVNGLQKAYRYIEHRLIPAGPHTSLAILVGYKVAQDYRNDMGSGGGRAYGPEIAFHKFVNQVYNFIRFGYYNLDQSYFQSFVRTCVGSRYCFEESFNPYAVFGDEYLEGMRWLALAMLDLLIENAEATGKNRLELVLTASVASTTNRLLNESVYRRDFACDIVGLWNLRESIFGYLNGRGSQGVPEHVLVNNVRSQVAAIYQSIKSKNGARCWSR